MNYFEVYLEGLAIMNARRESGMAINEGLFHPIHETAIQIMPRMSLEDMLLAFNSH